MTRGRGRLPTDNSHGRGSFDNSRGRGSFGGSFDNSRGRGANDTRGRMPVNGRGSFVGESRGANDTRGRGYVNGSFGDTRGRGYFAGESRGRGANDNNRGRGSFAGESRGRGSVDNNRGRGSFAGESRGRGGDTRGRGSVDNSRGRLPFAGESRGRSSVDNSRGAVNGARGRGDSRGRGRGAVSVTRGRGDARGRGAVNGARGRGDSNFKLSFLPIALESVLGQCTSFKMVRDAPALPGVKVKYFPAKSLFMISSGGRGVIRSMETGNIVCSAADITIIHLKGDTVTNDLPTSLLQDLKFAGNQAIVKPVHDAINIRLYYSGSEWLTATNNTIDANWKGAVYLNTKTFHVLFNETLTALGITLNYDTLPKDLTYFFLFTHPEYTNIIKNTEHTIQSVMVVQNGTQRIVPFTVNAKIPCPPQPQVITGSLIKVMNEVCTNVGVSVQIRNRVCIFKTSTFQRMEALKPRQDHSKSKTFYSDILASISPDPDRDVYYPEYRAVTAAAQARFEKTIDALFEYYNLLYSPEPVTADPDQKWGDDTPKVPKTLFNTRILSSIHAIMTQDPDFRAACTKVFENDIKSKTCIFEQAANFLCPLEAESK